MYEPACNRADAQFRYPGDLARRAVVINKEAGATATRHEPTCSHANPNGFYPTAHAGKTLVITERATATLLAALNVADLPDRLDEADYADGITDEPTFGYALAYC